MGGKVEIFEFEASTSRLWDAVIKSIGSAGYTVRHSDRQSGTVSFNTGRSMASWAGQDLTATISATPRGSRLTMGGSIARGGNPFGGGSQITAWGEKGRVIASFAASVRRTLPMLPEAKAAEATSDGALGLASELQKLADMRQSGMLSEAEFQSAKTRLLQGS